MAMIIHTATIAGTLAGIGLAVLWVWLWFRALVQVHVSLGLEARHIRAKNRATGQITHP
jgi:hypothetical protein